MAAVLHIAIIIGGPNWYRYFGAGEEFAIMAEQGSMVPPLVTFEIFSVLFLWGLYAFSGAGLIKKLPFLKIALVTISAVFLIRGVAVLPVWIIKPAEVGSLLIWSSLASLTIGLAYCFGTKGPLKNKMPFSHLIFGSSSAAPQSQNPQNNQLFLRFCSIGPTRSNHKSEREE